MVKTCFFCKKAFASSNRDRTFHIFPLNEDLRQKWFAAISTPYTDQRYIYLCSDHFSSSDFEHRYSNKILVRGAVPVVASGSSEGSRLQSPIPNCTYSPQTKDPLANSSASSSTISLTDPENDVYLEEEGENQVPLEYFGDCDDYYFMAQSKKVMRKWKIAKQTIFKLRKKIKILQQTTRRLNKRISNLKSINKHLMEQFSIKKEPSPL